MYTTDIHVTLPYRGTLSTDLLDPTYQYGYGDEKKSWALWQKLNADILMTASSSPNNNFLTGQRLLELNASMIPSLNQNQRDQLSFAFDYLRAYDALQKDDKEGEVDIISWTCDHCDAINDRASPTCSSCIASAPPSSRYNTSLPCDMKPIAAVSSYVLDDNNMASLYSALRITGSLPSTCPPKINEITMPSEWTLCIIIGGCSTGKTSVLRQFGTPMRPSWHHYRSIISHFSSPQQGEELLRAVGLHDICEWLKPYHILSSSQQYRASLARQLTIGNACVIDDFASTMDRSIAMNMCVTFSCYIKRHALKRITLTSRHDDIIPWLLPDCVIKLSSRSTYSDIKADSVVMRPSLPPLPPLPSLPVATTAVPSLPSSPIATQTTLRSSSRVSSIKSRTEKQHKVVVRVYGMQLDDGDMPASYHQVQNASYLMSEVNSYKRKVLAGNLKRLSYPDVPDTANNDLAKDTGINVSDDRLLRCWVHCDRFTEYVVTRYYDDDHIMFEGISEYQPLSFGPSTLSSVELLPRWTFGTVIGPNASGKTTLLASLGPTRKYFFLIALFVIYN
jgi:hypothetical protein